MRDFDTSRKHSLAKIKCMTSLDRKPDKVPITSSLVYICTYQSCLGQVSLEAICHKYVSLDLLTNHATSSFAFENGHMYQLYQRNAKLGPFCYGFQESCTQTGLIVVRKGGGYLSYKGSSA